MMSELETAVPTDEAPQTQDKVQLWKLAGSKLADQVTLGITAATARVTLSPYRALTDSTYLRAGLGNLWLVLPLVGLILGVVSAHQTGGLAVPSSDTAFLGLMVLGILDAFSGLVGFIPFLVWSIVTGHVDSLHAVGGLLGVAIMWFLGAQAAHSIRPVGRWDDEPTRGSRIYKIAGDMVLLPIVGAFIMGAFDMTLPYLTGYKVPIASELTKVHIVALVAFALRAAGEALVVYNFRDRLASLVWPTLPHRNTVVTVAVKAIQLFFVYVLCWSFLGHDWQTWLLVAIYASFPIVVWAGRQFPESTFMHRITPRSALKLAVVILFVQLLVREFMPRFADPQIALGWVFVGLAVFVLMLLALEQFRGKAWPETWLTRIFGMAAIVLFLAVAQGYLTFN